MQLSGEELQAVSGNITAAVAFMIDNATELFKVPKELGDDVKAYWFEQETENRKQSAYHALKSKVGNALNPAIGSYTCYFLILFVYLLFVFFKYKLSNFLNCEIVD